MVRGRAETFQRNSHRGQRSNGSLNQAPGDSSSFNDVGLISIPNSLPDTDTSRLMRRSYSEFHQFLESPGDFILEARHLSRFLLVAGFTGIYQIVTIADL